MERRPMRVFGQVAPVPHGVAPIRVRAPRAQGIPVLDVGGKVVTGFSPDEYDRLIARART